MTDTTAAITYTSLATINVNDHTEKKNGLTYLSWAWAVDQLLRLDPDASWDYRLWEGRPVCYLPDQTALVCCTVSVGGRSKTAWLPVMDHKNRAIVLPDAFAINVAMQRALVKAIALAGIGLYIYMGDAEPSESDTDAPHPLDGYADWLVAMGLIADGGNFAALVEAIKEYPVFAAHLKANDLASWTALKARQEAVVAPAMKLVQSLRAAGLPVSDVTVAVGEGPFTSLSAEQRDRATRTPPAADEKAFTERLDLLRAAVTKAVKRMPS